MKNGNEIVHRVEKGGEGGRVSKSTYKEVRAVWERKSIADHGLMTALAADTNQIGAPFQASLHMSSDSNKKKTRKREREKKGEYFE